MAFAVNFNAGDNVLIPDTGGKVLCINPTGGARGTLASGETGIISSLAAAEHHITVDFAGVPAAAVGAWTQPMVDAVRVTVEDLSAGGALAEHITVLKTLVADELQVALRNGGAAAQVAGLRVFLHYMV